MSNLAAKRKAAQAAAEKPESKQPKLSTEAKAARALGSQGKPQLIEKRLVGKERERLAACCNDDGTLREDTPQVVAEVLAEFYEQQKATVSDGTDGSTDQGATPVASEG